MNGTNEAAVYVASFSARAAMTKIGYTYPVSSLDVFTAEVYGIIAAEIAGLIAGDMKRMKGRKRG